MGIWKILLSVGLGALLSLAFAPFDQTWVVWLVPPAALALFWGVGQDGTKKRKTFAYGYFFGLGFWLLNLKWLATVAGLGVIAISAFLALYPALFAVFAGHVANPWARGGGRPGMDSGVKARAQAALRSLGFATAVGFFWAGLEWCRGWVLTGFGWNGLGVALRDLTSLTQAAEWIGVSGLSFIPIFFGAVVAQVARRLYTEAAEKTRLLHWDFAFAMLLLAGLFFAGSWRIHHLLQLPTSPLKVLLVQQNIPQFATEVRWDPQRVHSGYEDLTLEALNTLYELSFEDDPSLDPSAGSESSLTESLIPLQRPDWIIWPEAALMEWIIADGKDQRAMGQLSGEMVQRVRAESGASLFLGAVEISGQAEGDLLVAEAEAEIWNSLLVFPPNKVPTSYRKIHLVPFGETLPDIPGLAWLYEKAAGVEYAGSFTPGRSFDPIPHPHRDLPLSIIPTICFEDTVGRLTRKFLREDPQVILNVTNDGWFLESEAAEQHFQNAQFRAIELRRPLIRCANTGVSAIVSIVGSSQDPKTGRVRELRDQEGSSFTRDTLFAVAHLPLDPPTTLYARFGDWFSVFGLIIGLGLIIFRIIKPTLTKNTPTPHD